MPSVILISNLYKCHLSGVEVDMIVMYKTIQNKSLGVILSVFIMNIRYLKFCKISHGVMSGQGIE